MTERRQSHMDYDVLIVGAGPVGAVLALLLARRGFHAAVVEARPLETDPGPGGGKALALSAGSIRTLDRVGVWRDVAPEASPIRQVHVSQRGRFGVTRLRAEDLGLDTLGHVVPARPLTAALHTAIQAAGAVEVMAPARLEDRAMTGTGQELVLKRDQATWTCRAPLLVGADGARSATRALLGIAAHGHDYDEHALSAAVTVARAHGDRAFERFTPEGPMALLPLNGNRMGLVWTGSPAAVHARRAWDEATFLERAHEAFGNRLGAFESAGERLVFPLRASRAAGIVRPGAVLVGNAAQALHPVAAQGLNLGLRDVTGLVEAVARARSDGVSFGDESMLQRYARRRAPDRRATDGFTHGLALGFKWEWGPLGGLRGLGLAALDGLTPVKRRLAERLAGV